jgi:4-alpha-glucanotransferase
VLGILALESVRARCVVIGEDLGTVPLGFRERMADAHALSYRILSFEREADNAFIPPERYPALALAAVGTHDLAPFFSWLDASDIALREKLGLIDEALAGAERTEREIDHRRLISTFIQSGDLDPHEPDASAIMIAAYRYLARSPAAIVMVHIDDAIGELTPVNVPGTSDQYPNWRRKLSLDLDAIGSDQRFARLAAVLHAERPVYSEKNVVSTAYDQ